MCKQVRFRYWPSLVAINLGLALTFAGVPSKGQMEQLVRIIWLKVDIPDSLDMTYMRTAFWPFDLQKCRSEVQGLLGWNDEVLPGSLTSEEVALMLRSMEYMVQLKRKESEVGEVIKCRVRISSNAQRMRYRIDSVHAVPDVVIFEGTSQQEVVDGKAIDVDTEFQTTEVAVCDGQTGTVRAFEYQHGSKRAIKGLEKRRKVSKFRTPREELTHLGFIPDLEALIPLFGRIGSHSKPPSARQSERACLGNPERELSSLYSPDTQKIATLSRTGSVEDGPGGRLEVTVLTESNGPIGMDKFEIKYIAVNGFELRRVGIAVDSRDYSRCYIEEHYFGGKPARIVHRSRFGKNNLPLEVFVRDFDQLTGNLRGQIWYTVLELQLGSHIPDQVFEFLPPDGYRVSSY